MNYKETLAAKISAAQATIQMKREEAMLALLDNEAFIETQRTIVAKENELQTLKALVTQVNTIKAFVAKDGKKYGVNVFPINGFNSAVSLILGFINNVPFIEEQQLQYIAILGIPLVELLEAQIALGKPAYYKDGIVHDAIPYNYLELAALVKSIGIKLNIFEYSLDITKEAMEAYFLSREVAAHKKKEAADTSTAIANVANQLIEGGIVIED